MVFSKEKILESGKIKAEVDIELPGVDENGRLTKVKDTLLISPVTNIQSDRLNKLYKDDSTGLGIAIIKEATGLEFSPEEFKELGTGTTGTIINKINEVSGLEKDYMKEVRRF